MNRSILRASVLLAISGVCGVIVACGSDDSGDGRPPGALPVGPDPNATAVLHPGSEVLEPALSDVADVRPGEVRFPPGECDRLGKLKPGQVILGDRGPDGSPNPDGFLVKVTKVECTPDGVIVGTEPGTLQTTFDKLKFDAGFNLPGCNDVKKPNMGVTYGGPILQYTDKIRLADGRDIPFIGTVGIDTALCFAPKLDYKADVEWLKINSFQVSINGPLEAKALINAAVKLDDPNPDPKVVEELAGKPLQKTITKTLADSNISLGSTSVGPIRIPASVRYVTTLTCEMAFTLPVEVEVGAKETVTLSAGLKYENSKISPIWSHSEQFEPVPPTFKKDGLIRLHCTLNPSLQLKLFGIASGEIGARAFGGMGASQTCGGKDPQTNITQRLVHGDVQAGAVATVLAKLELLGKKWKKECTLFSADTMTQYDRTYPTPGGAAATTCSTAGPYPLPPKPTANPDACFGEEDGVSINLDGGDGGEGGLIDGPCAHDVCTAGERLGQRCDDCTMKICDADPYCCDTFWGLSCFDDVSKYCGKTCQ